MDYLWSPWRYNYVTKSKSDARKGVPDALSGWPIEEDLHCVFCNLLACADYAIAHGMSTEQADRAANIVYRGQHCYLCLNAFPYGTGHILIVPHLHTASLATLSPEAAHELISLAQRSEAILQKVYRPNGFNFGLNLGEAAGAGVAEHIHMHGLPRWSGDTNFMTVISETRVLPEALDVTWNRLRREFYS